jgi:MFS family permease
MQFLRRAPKTPFGKYVIFRAFFSVAIGLAAPFFTVYLLRDLGLSYIWYILIIASGTFFQLIFLPLLGKVSDIYGNVKLTKISAGLMFLIPLLWYFSSFISPFYQRIYLLIIPNIVSGFAWAGYNLATNNYVYDSVSVQKRGFAASYMNLIVGISVFIGALLGSFLVSYIFFIKPILFVFLISSGARLIVFLFGVKHLKEVRPVKKFSSRFLIKEFHPLQELMRNITYLEHFVNKEKI